LRPALPAQVNAVAGRPRKIKAHGVSGEIVAYAGPWRSSGDWWKADPWSRDEWDIAVDSGGLYRIYREPHGGWYVEGNYD